MLTLLQLSHPVLCCRFPPPFYPSWFCSGSVQTSIIAKITGPGRKRHTSDPDPDSGSGSSDGRPVSAKCLKMDSNGSSGTVSGRGGGGQHQKRGAGGRDHSSELSSSSSKKKQKDRANQESREAKKSTAAAEGVIAEVKKGEWGQNICCRRICAGTFPGYNICERIMARPLHRCCEMFPCVNPSTTVCFTVVSCRCTDWFDNWLFASLPLFSSSSALLDLLLAPVVFHHNSVPPLHEWSSKQRLHEIAMTCVLYGEDDGLALVRELLSQTKKSGRE